jgi:hypothetical protein
MHLHLKPLGGALPTRQRRPTQQKRLHPCLVFHHQQRSRRRALRRRRRAQQRIGRRVVASLDLAPHGPAATAKFAERQAGRCDGQREGLAVGAVCSVPSLLLLRRRQKDAGLREEAQRVHHVLALQYGPPAQHQRGQQRVHCTSKIIQRRGEDRGFIKKGSYLEK